MVINTCLVGREIAVESCWTSDDNWNYRSFWLWFVSSLSVGKKIGKRLFRIMELSGWYTETESLSKSFVGACLSWTVTSLIEAWKNRASTFNWNFLSGAIPIRNHAFNYPPKCVEDWVIQRRAETHKIKAWSISCAFYILSNHSKSLIFLKVTLNKLFGGV